DKIILMKAKEEGAAAVRYAIDKKDGDLTLEGVTDEAITSLPKNENGFFLMVVGGKFDWSSHANDATMTIWDVLDFNEAVKRAFAFYEKFPEETLLLVTADHETGGIAIGNGSSRLNTKLLANQRVSQGALSQILTSLRSTKDDVSWEEVKRVLTD